MKKRVLVPVLSAIAAASNSGLPPAAADASEVTGRLPGKYKLSYRGTLLSLDAVKTYYADGSYESVGTARVFGIERDLAHRGNWKLDRGELVYILTDSSTPREAPVGVPLRFKVISHDGRTLRYRDESRKKTYSERRIGDATK